MDLLGNYFHCLLLDFIATTYTTTTTTTTTTTDTTVTIIVTTKNAIMKTTSDCYFIHPIHHQFIK